MTIHILKNKTTFAIAIHIFRKKEKNWVNDET